MKKKIIHLVALFGAMGIYAQTGIGTPLPNASSALEVYSENKGMLIPRVALKGIKDTETIKGANYPESLLVYNLGTTELEAGFYFWSQDEWKALVSNTTLYTYIKETAKEGNVTINNVDGKFTVTWIDKETKEEKTIGLDDFIAQNNNSYESGKETLIGKFEGKDIVRYTFKYTAANAFTSVTLPIEIKGMIVNATLINESTSAIVRGVLGKNITNGKTDLSLGTVGTIITSNPAGTYYVVVEYVK